MVRLATILIGILASVLLMLSLFNLKNVFELVNNTTAHFLIKSCKMHGITILFKARINIHSALDCAIELAQMKIIDVSGKYLDSWTGEVKNKEDFLLSFSNVELFSGELKKVIIDGFVRVKLNVGRSGIKINLPVKAEVSFVGR